MIVVLLACLLGAAPPTPATPSPATPTAPVPAAAPKLDLEGLVTRGLAAEARDDWEEAARSWLAAASAAPSDPRVTAARARLLSKAKELFQDAYVLRTTDPAKATAMLRLVQRIVTATGGEPIPRRRPRPPLIATPPPAAP